MFWKAVNVTLSVMLGAIAAIFIASFVLGILSGLLGA